MRAQVYSVHADISTHKITFSPVQQSARSITSFGVIDIRAAAYICTVTSLDVIDKQGQLLTFSATICTVTSLDVIDRH
jgi:hypothetical protein